MPKLVDYAGRFTFFEEACFALVRDRGVHHLTRHQVSHVLGTSISTVRRLLRPEVDLRSLALNELGLRRRQGRFGRLRGDPLEIGVQALSRLIADQPERIAEELVWWRLSVAAPTQAELPADAATTDEGPLHHRFAVASHGYLPSDVLGLHIDGPTLSRDSGGHEDVVMTARRERQADIDAVVTDVVSHLAPELDDASASRAGALVKSLIDGVGLGVCLGRITPGQAVDQLRHALLDLQVLARVAACPTTSRP